MKTPIASLWVVMLALGMTMSARADEPPRLPRDHEYQRVLYDYMATITEQDLTHGVEGLVTVQPGRYKPEYLYRQYIYGMMLQPLIGTKRGAPAINAAPITFTLPYIEVTRELTHAFHNPRTNQTKTLTAPPGVYFTHAWPEVLMSFVQWDYPGNPYHNNRALKLRAFMAAASDMMMFHHAADHSNDFDPPRLRPDWHGYSPVRFAYPYPAFKDVLPENVQKAYETGLKMIGQRMLAWGIRGESCEHDYIAPVGLLAIARAIDDPRFDQAVREYAQPLYTDARYFHPAGYWNERGGIETGFSGNANWFAAWTGLMTDWPFVTAALERVYRLRRHLLLPEPDGTWTGPSHFNVRLGSPVNEDQWPWYGTRDAAVSMLTDQAAQFVDSIDDQQLVDAPARRVHLFNEALNENIRIDGYYLTNEDMLAFKLPPLSPWRPRMWMTYNFPASVNPGYEHYRDGAWAHRRKLEEADSPLLKSPFVTGESFIRAFETDFLITREPTFAAIIHAGPLGTQNPTEHKAQFAGPLGLGGGQLSAFWTPATGPVILGLRKGMSYDQSFDQLDAWRTWPNHSINGLTRDGRIVTSARNAQPDVRMNVTDRQAGVTIVGSMVAYKLAPDPMSPDPAKPRDALYDQPLGNQLVYERRFVTDDTGVTITTTVHGDASLPLTELYDVLPIYLGADQPQIEKAGPRITCLVNGHWLPVTEQFLTNVQALRLRRFGGEVEIRFDQPQRVGLSPARWTDNWLNEGATCRNVLIDLLHGPSEPVAIREKRTVQYTIRPVPPDAATNTFQATDGGL